MKKIVLITLLGLVGLGFFLDQLVWSTAVSVQTPVGPYPASVAATDLDIVWTTAGNVSTATTAYDTFTCTGAELLLIYNSGGTVKGVTIDSQPDNLSRENDIANYQVGAGTTAAFWLGNIVGWRDSNNNVNVQAESTDIKFGILRIQK